MGRSLTFDARVNPFELDAPELRDLIASKSTREIGNWREIGAEEYARSFTAAQTMGYDIVRDLHREFLATLQTQGETEQDFVERVLPIMRRKGWLADKDDQQAATRLLLIYDTNLRTSQAVGRWGRIQKTKAALPYLYSFTAADERVRHPPKSEEDHRAFEGILLPVDHPFWLSYFPPLGFRCRCQVVQKSRGQAARMGPVTSEAELAQRRARLGPPWGFTPGRQPLEGVDAGAERANRERLDGAPIINVQQLKQVAREAFEEAAPKGFRSPINPAVTAATIKVEPRVKVQKRLRAEFAEAHKDARYQGPQDRWAGSAKDDNGNAKFSAEFDDEAVSMLAALKPELDDLARQIGVPPVRGFKGLGPTSKASANMGDGVMGLNPSYFNGTAATVGGRSPQGSLAQIEAKRAAIKEEIRPLGEEASRLRAEYTALTGDARRARMADYYDEMTRITKEVEKLRNVDKRLWYKEQHLKPAVNPKPANTWKRGDGKAARPRGSDDYFVQPVDKARSTVFHEFGHHVHQYLNKNPALNRRAMTPPLETALADLYRTYRRSRLGTSATTYSDSNQYEWFAENFSLYVMGRKDLVDDTLLELIERIFLGRFL